MRMRMRMSKIVGAWSLEDEDDDKQDGEVEDGDDVDDHGNFSNPL